MTVLQNATKLLYFYKVTLLSLFLFNHNKCVTKLLTYSFEIDPCFIIPDINPLKVTISPKSNYVLHYWTL